MRTVMMTIQKNNVDTKILRSFMQAYQIIICNLSQNNINFF